MSVTEVCWPFQTCHDGMWVAMMIVVVTTILTKSGVCLT